MSMYKPQDVELLVKNWDSIMENVEQQKYKLLEPTFEEMMEIHEIILDFLRKNKRKLYGGYALNLLVKMKNPNDAIYKPNKIPDIDFYSFDPMTDLIKLCNILQEKKFKYVVGREALHQETYSISVNQITYCDISYVPKMIYDRMPFIIEQGLTLIHPHFMMIDYLRMMTDPLISYWRFDNDLKSFRRYVLLQKHYPFPTNTGPVENFKLSSSVNSALSTIFKFVCNNKTVMVIGFYAYNYFAMTAKMKGVDTVSIPYFEMISTDYRNDALSLIDKLKLNVTINKDGINHTEYYPFFQFTGHSVDIYLENEIIARIYNNNNKCIPYLEVPAYDFIENVPTKNVIRLGTYSVVILYGLITIMKARTNKDDYTKNLYYSIVSQLINMRNYYLEKTKKTFLDDTVFKEFVVNCMGDAISPDRQRKLLIESRKRKNKKYTFIYEPADGLKEPESKYIFANSSGNYINNPRNLKLAAEPVEIDIEGDFDEAAGGKSQNPS